MAAVTVAIWGTTFVSTKVLIGHRLSATDILFYRFIMAYICIWFFSPRILWAKSWRDEGIFVLLGLTGGSLYFIAENTALGMTLASNVSLIICTAPILAAFLSFFFYKGERLKPKLIYDSLMALGGVALVVFKVVLFFVSVRWEIFWHFGCCFDGGPSIVCCWSVWILITLLFLLLRKVFFYGILTLLPFSSFILCRQIPLSCFNRWWLRIYCFWESLLPCFAI